MAGLTIGIPTLGRPLNMKWAVAFKGLNPPMNVNTVHAHIEGHPVAIARNAIVAQALKNNHDYVFFLGDDVIVPPHTLRQMFFMMAHHKNVGVIGGVYCSKSEPPAPLVFQGNGSGSYWDWKIGEFFECTGLGMDCTMIRTDVFRQLANHEEIPTLKSNEELQKIWDKEEWFKTVDTDSFIDGINHAEQWTEDLYFLERVKKETSWKIYCDASIICDHYDIYSGKIYSVPTNSKPRQPETFEVGKKIIVDIGCGPRQYWRDFGTEGTVKRVDIRKECEPDYVCDVRRLLFANESIDVVFSSHCLEHFPRSEWEEVVAEWLRILKQGGELRLVLPNIMWAAEQLIQNQGMVNNDILNVFYGAQSNPFDYHYNGLTPARLKAYFADKYGMTIKEEQHSGYNMMLNFVKPVL